MIKTRIIKLAGNVKLKREGRGTFRIFVGKCEGKKTTRRPRRRWVKQSCIKVYLKVIGRAGLGWFHLAQNRNSVIKFLKIRGMFD